MQVFDVKFLDMTKAGTRYFILFASDHATVDDLTEDLRENTVVSGVRLIWHREGSEIVVDDEMPIMLSKHSIYTVGLPNSPVARYEA